MEKSQVTKTMKETLLSAIETCGLLETLNEVFGKSVRVRLAWSEKELATPMTDFEFSTRSANALHNAHAETVGAILDLIETGKLDTLRNVGKKSLSEIRSSLLAFNYKNLSREERLEFCADVIALNCELEASAA